jgi:hypothetical protein
MKIKFKRQLAFDANICFAYECPLTSELALLKLPVASVMAETLSGGSVLKKIQADLETKCGEKVELEEIHNPILNK